MASLPSFPAIQLRVVEDVTPAGGRDGFLQLQRWTLQLTFPDGTTSATFPYDEVTRVSLDAVCMVAWYRESGVPFVYLRTSFRPPAAMRPLAVRPVPERETLGHLWEIPAGLVERHERSPRGLLEAAARELDEELGFAIRPEQLSPLGSPLFSSPGMCGERLFFFDVEVVPSARHTPSEDGSPLEKFAEIVALPLAEALDLCRRGDIDDMKTEVGLRRIADRLSP